MKGDGDQPGFRRSKKKKSFKFGVSEWFAVIDFYYMTFFKWRCKMRGEKHMFALVMIWINLFTIWSDYKAFGGSDKFLNAIQKK